jgi:hypothetical protein
MRTDFCAADAGRRSGETGRRRPRGAHRRDSIDEDDVEARQELALRGRSSAKQPSAPRAGADLGNPEGRPQRLDELAHAEAAVVALDGRCTRALLHQRLAARNLQPLHVRVRHGQAYRGHWGSLRSATDLVEVAAIEDLRHTDGVLGLPSHRSRSAAAADTGLAERSPRSRAARRRTARQRCPRGHQPSHLQPREKRAHHPTSPNESTRALMSLMMRSHVARWLSLGSTSRYTWLVTRAAGGWRCARIPAE